MFEEQSSVPDAMLPWRATVIAFKQPRRQLVQPVTRIQGDDVVLQVFLCLDHPSLAVDVYLYRSLKRRLLDCVQAMLHATGLPLSCVLSLTLYSVSIIFRRPASMEIRRFIVTCSSQAFLRNRTRILSRTV
jgi:hypothetical protein